jgi:hypothetical protein
MTHGEIAVSELPHHGRSHWTCSAGAFMRHHTSNGGVSRSGARCDLDEGLLDASMQACGQRSQVTQGIDTNPHPAGSASDTCVSSRARRCT